MTNPFKVLAISLIPNFRVSEVVLALGLFLMPWTYFDPGPSRRLEQELKNYLGREFVFLFESGRAAEFFLLKSLGIGSGDEVIIQAFTCVAVPNSIIWTGAKPVYVDVDESLNMDPKELEKAITPRTKAVIIQHTFGKPADVGKIKLITSKQGVALIEDCAHGLGNCMSRSVGEQESRKVKIGTVGKAAFFSFGRDKVISGVWGGAVAVDDGELANKIRSEIQDTRFKTQGRRQETRNRIWVAKQLLYPILVYLVLNTYSFFGFGKALHKLLQKLGLLSRVVTAGEKRGERPEIFYQDLPGALAVLVLEQLRNLDDFVDHRKKLARFYDSQLGTGYDPKSSYLRSGIEVEDSAGLRRFAARQNIFLGDWYDSVVAPKDVDLEAVGYKLGSCPKAEEVCRRIVNLPTNPNLSLDDASRVAIIVKQWLASRGLSS